VAQISTRAGVSSATFYEQFTDKEDCLLEAYEAARARVLQPSSDACATPWTEAASVALKRLAEAVRRDPDAARVVFVEALAGEARMRERRKAHVEESEAQIAAYFTSAEAGAEAVDLPIGALEGARRYVIARHLRTHSEDRLPALVDDMVAWVGC